MPDRFGFYNDITLGKVPNRYIDQDDEAATDAYFSLASAALNYVWDAPSNRWIRMTPSAGGGGGGMTDAEFAAHLPLAVTGPLTDAQLRAIPVPVSGTFWQATQPISAVALPLPAGAATDLTLQAVRDRLPAALAAGRLDVSIGASPATVPISAAALPLPIGAATDATLATMLTTAAFQARINTLGAKTSALSTPVVLATDQATLAVAVGTPPDLAPAAPTSASVGVASSSIVAANGARKGAVITVTTAGRRVSLGFDGAAAVLDSGVTLYGPGGVYEMDERTFTTGEIRAIADSAATNVAIQEYA